MGGSEGMAAVSNSLLGTKENQLDRAEPSQLPWKDHKPQIAENGVVDQWKQPQREGWL